MLLYLPNTKLKGDDYMLLLKKLDRLDLKEMTPMEIAIQYYLIRTDTFKEHTKYMNWQIMCGDLFGEETKPNPKLSKEYTTAIEHFEELGYITINNKRVNFEQFIIEKGDAFNSIDYDAYRIFKRKDIGIMTKLKIFKFYVYIISIMIWRPETRGRTFEGVRLGLASSKSICENYGISYTAFANYTQVLEELELIYIDKRETYTKENGKLKRLPNVYSYPEDKDTAIEYVDFRNRDNSTFTSKKNKDESAKHKRYMMIYTQVQKGNCNYEYEELVDCYNYLHNNNTKKLSNYNTKQDVKDLSKLSELICTLKTQQAKSC